MKHETSRFVPILVAIGVVCGILVGSFFASHNAPGRLSIIKSGSNKVNDLFHLIDDEYVDSVDIQELVEKSMPQILRQLDPHSVYVPAKDVELAMQDLQGHFSGIGVQFTIYNDTVRIIRIIRGGPSESVGLKAGDRIVAIDGSPFVGEKVTNEETMKHLKGEKGSLVKLSVMRTGSKAPLTFSIVRGDVPVKSISSAYMLNDSTGYIRINSFGETTYPEFLASLAMLGRQQLGALVIDLRGNLGGYMDPAVQIANEFLPKDRLIVYTEGRRSPRQNYRSDGRGSYQTLPLVLLVDETSASASEILSGAIQDNDRGTIVGRRTFGKGLVQVPIQFDDGSMLRLTKARYYTPSGRCVQKPYTPGDEDDYEADLLLRATGGEYYSADSIKTSGQEYKTTLGRTVYGGGGIIPDVFVARDTTHMTSYFKEAYMRGLIFQFAFAFSDDHRESLTRLGSIDEVVKYINRHNLPEEFAVFAERAGLKRRNLLLQQSANLFHEHITSNVINDILDDDAATQYVNQTDPAVLTALDIVQRGATFPKAGGMDNIKKTSLLQKPDYLAFTYDRVVLFTRVFNSQIDLVPIRPIHYTFAICPSRKRVHYANA